LTYAEFALICGSNLLSSANLCPMQRLHQCLDQTMVQAHVVWAVSTVHMLGKKLKEQYLSELGFLVPGSRIAATPNGGSGSSSNGSSSAKSAKSATNAYRQQPFKLFWTAHWIDVDSSLGDADFDNVASSLTSAGGAAAGKEKVYIPGGMSACLRGFLHRVNQHGAAAVVSIDTMQSLQVAASHSSSSSSSSRSGGGGMKEEEETASQKAAAQLRSEFADLLEDDEEASGGARAGGSSSSSGGGISGQAAGQVLAMLAGTSSSVGAGAGARTNSGPGAVVLAHLAQRLLVHLSLAYINHISVSALLLVRPPAGSSTNSTYSGVSNESLEEAAVQGVFDLTLCEMLAKQWGLCSSSATATTGSSGARRAAGARAAGSAGAGAAGGLAASVERWKRHLDPITAELTQPLVAASLKAHAHSVSLLLPHCSPSSSRSSSTGTGAGAAAGVGAAMAAISSAGGGKSSGPEKSEEVLARIFPSARHAAARFTQLPLAVNTVVASSLPPSGNNATGRNASNSPVRSTNAGSSYTGKAGAASGTNGTSGSADGSGNVISAKKEPVGIATPSSKTGVLNWWG
jgi:hypothetical protein